MNRPITDMANALTYAGELEIANEVIANATLTLPEKEQLLQSPPWVVDALDDSLSSAVCILNTGAVNCNTENAGCSNRYETAIVYTLVNTLLEVSFAIL